MIFDAILSIFYFALNAILSFLYDGVADVSVSTGFGSAVAYFATATSFINNFIPISDLVAVVVFIITIEMGIAVYKIINKSQKLLPGRGG